MHFDVPETDLIRWRRHLHEHPELAYREEATSAYVEQELRAIGVDGIERPAKTSLVAWVKGTKPTDKPTKTVALRCDLDALPVEEASDLPFKSKNPGVSHVCGHDAHMAMMLATAKVLAQHRDAFSGTVKFFFQHAEEQIPGGAAEMVAAGVMEGVDAVVGLHVWNAKTGTILVATDRQASTASDSTVIRIEGCGAHGSAPHTGIDPILVGAEIVQALHTIVSRNINPEHFAVVSPTIFRAGTVVNVIPQTAEIGLNTRTKDPEDRKLIKERIFTICESVAKAHGAKVEVEWEQGYAAIEQSDDMINRALRVCRETLGEENVGTWHGMSASEDFSAFSAEAPGVYLILGCGSAEEGCPYSNHHPSFRVREEALPVGVRVEVAMALDYLNG